MNFYLDKIIKLIMPTFTDRWLKHILILLAVALTDVGVFFIAGLMLASVGDIRSTALLIVIMFITAAASFFCRRLLAPQLCTVADKALIRKKSEKAYTADDDTLTNAVREIRNRRQSLLTCLMASVNLIICLIVILITSPLSGIISVGVTVFCVYISGRKTQAIQKAVDKLFSVKHNTANKSNDDETMTDDDNEIYLQNEVTETEAETKTLLHIAGIIGWTVSCFVPIILGQTLSQCVTAAVMQLYFVWQTHILADTFSDISIITYNINKIDNME